MRDAVPALYKEGGAGAFFRGLGPTMIRYVFHPSSFRSISQEKESGGIVYANEAPIVGIGRHSSIQSLSSFSNWLCDSFNRLFPPLARSR